MQKINLTLGEWFSLDLRNEPAFYGLAMARRLVWGNDRPVGHWTSADRRSESRGFLWLQNYAGYNCADFVYEFGNVDLALSRAKEILAEWDVNPERPIWVA